MDETLNSSHQKLNEEFFRRQNAELLEKLKTDMQLGTLRDQLAQVTGIHNTELLDELVKAGISAESLPALRLVPLVVVAWSDSQLHDKEREAVLQAARNQGIAENSPSHALLDQWLRERPSPSLLNAWKDYVRALCTALSPGGIRMLREEVMDGAEQVARAAGGFLGIQAISPGEAKTIKELRDAFVGAD